MNFETIVKISFIISHDFMSVFLEFGITYVGELLLGRHFHDGKHLNPIHGFYVGKPVKTTSAQALTFIAEKLKKHFSQLKAGRQVP